jgi:putative ABC transport system substrate-binding protein
MIRRREFITLLGGAAAARPRVAQAQQGDRVRRVGVLMPYDENEPAWKPRLSAFMQALADLGWTVGRNVRIDLRWAGGRARAARDCVPSYHRVAFSGSRQCRTANQRARLSSKLQPQGTLL